MNNLARLPEFNDGYISEEEYKAHAFENMMQRFENTGVNRAHEYLGRRLGEGYFSQVFVCPWDDTKAIKIGQGPNSTGHMWGDGWLHYAAYSMERRKQGSKNPLLVDVHRIYLGKNRKWYAALVDRYDMTYNDSREYRDDSQSELLIRRYNAIRTILGDRHGDRLRNGKHSNFDPEYLSWAAELFNDKDFRFDDLHNHNLMVKGNRIIINDPYGTSGYNEDTSQRLKRLGLVSADEDLRPDQRVDRVTGIVRAMQMRPEMMFNPFAFDGPIFFDLEVDEKTKTKPKAEKKKKQPELKGWKKGKSWLKGVNDVPKARRKKAA